MSGHYWDVTTCSWQARGPHSPVPLLVAQRRDHEGIDHEGIDTVPAQPTAVHAAPAEALAGTS